MADPLNSQALEQTFLAALAGAWGRAMGAAASTTPADTPTGSGWAAEVAVSGAARGRLLAWFARETTIACAGASAGRADQPADSDVADLLRTVVEEAVGAVAQGDGVPELTFGEVTVVPGTAPAAGAGMTLEAEGRPACRLAVVVDLLPAATLTPTSDLARLDTVLDVELPLTVRFGQVVMPLRALADLGPGSVVDMGRSPDEPVELLVGGRLIARGEVVVVGGNYGVRITELTGARPGLKDWEAKAS